MESFAIWFLLIIGFWAGYATRHFKQVSMDRDYANSGHGKFAIEMIVKAKAIKQKRRFIGEGVSIISSETYSIKNVGDFEIPIRDCVEK
jgi:hypothetical protein